MLSIYNSVLDRRHEMKRVLLEYGFMDLKFVSYAFDVWRY